MKEVLVVADDNSLMRLIEPSLNRIKLAVIKATSGYEALAMVRSRRLDLILLDMRLPDIDGWEVLAGICRISKVPLIILTVEENEEDMIRALEMGADDHVSKPVSMKELVARVQALLRRTERYEMRDPALFCDRILRINLAEQRVFKNGREIRLTPMEFNLLHYLLDTAGHFIKPAEILSRVWGPEYFNDVDLLRTCIWQLRRKLEPNPAQPRYIVNRPGFGYAFEGKPSEHA